MIERASYCIQFQIGTKTVKILKFKMVSQSREQIIIDLLEWRELESKNLDNLEKNWLCLSHLREKKYGFSYDSNEKYFEEVVDLRYGNSFHLLTTENLLQMMVFEEKVEFGIFNRDPKKCFSPLRISRHG